MTLRHLQIFLCVCDENNMTKAAGRLHMTQPSVSLAIRELESHYNVLLFERLGRRLYITDAGRRLLTYARHMISLSRQAESELHTLSDCQRLRVGASVTIGEALLVDLLQHASRNNPRLDLFSEIHNTAELESMLLKDELDLALIEGKVASEYLRVEPFLVDELIFIISPDSAFLTKPEIHPSDLSALKFFVREAGSGTRDLFESTLRQLDVSVQLAGVYNNPETIKKAVMAGLGASVISRRSVTRELAQGTLATFSVKGALFQRNFSVVYHQNKYHSPAFSNFLTICHSFEKDVLEPPV